MRAIRVSNLQKDFEYYEKEQGIKNSFKNLFFRKTLIRNAVCDISFDIDCGEIVGFLGPNGAGKTTTLKMLSGIMFPTNGSAEVLGFVPWQRKNEFKRQFSIVMGQKNQLWWDLPANESLYLNKKIYEIGDKDYKDIVEELTTMLEIKDLLKVQVRRLSLGERMKMELVAALIHKPKVLFLDEPTIGLDLISQNNIREFLKKYNQKSNTTIILTSHYMVDIEEMCKRTIVINHGKIVYDGELSKIDEVLSSKKIAKIKLSKPASRELLDEIGSVKEFKDMEATIEIAKNDVKKCSRMILDNLEVYDFNIEDIPIEESIALLYKKKG